MAPNVGLGTAGPIQRGWPLYILSVVMVIVAGLFVAVRMGTAAARKRLGMDDWTTLLSLISSVILSVTEIEAVVNGYGRHARDLPHEQVIIALKWFFAAQIMYKVVITLNKVSILCLYYRIFSVERWFRWTTYGGIAFIASSGFAYIVATIFQCTPVYSFWDKSTKNMYCISRAPFWQSYAVLNIITDFAILALPLSQIAKLRLPRLEKVGLSIIFALGAFVCVTSIVRTTTLVLSAKDRDPTWVPLPATVWSVIEANSGIICACLPKLRRPLSFISPCPMSKVHLSDLTQQANSRAYRLDSKSGPPPPSPVADPPWIPRGGTVTTWAATGKGMPAQGDGDGGETDVLRAGEGIHISTTTNTSATYIGDRRRSSGSSFCRSSSRL